MPRYYDTIGDGSRGFVANGPFTVGPEWSTTTSTIVTLNGTDIDMTDAPEGERHEHEGWIVVRTATGVKVKDEQGTRPRRRTSTASNRVTKTAKARPEENWYSVDLRSHAAPVTGTMGFTIGVLPVRGVQFEVVLAEDDIPRRDSETEQIAAQRREAAMYAVGNIASQTDWPAGKYMVAVRNRSAQTTFVADIDEHRSFTLLPRNLEERHDT